MNTNYVQEEVKFSNKAAGVTLAGTLSLPKAQGPFPAIVLISGMGPNDRDYTMLGKKLFFDVADFLTRQGIAVLRYDKRGAGTSTGAFSTNLTSEDFAQDAATGIEYLKNRSEINPLKIGVLGHSEGALIAAMLAAQRNDIAFVISLAGAAVTNSASIVEQAGMQLRADGASEKIIAQTQKLWRAIFSVIMQNQENVQSMLQIVIAEYFKQLPERLAKESEKFHFAMTPAKADGMIAMFTSPWYRYFLTHDPVATFKQIHVPVLALYGDHDFITVARLHMPILKEALANAGNIDFTILELPNMNHWFQTCKTGSMSEYATIQKSISSSVLALIADWIGKRTH